MKKKVLIGLTVLLVFLLGVGTTLWITSDSTDRPGAQPPTQPPVTGAPAPKQQLVPKPDCVTTWEVVGNGEQVPVSSCYGPAITTGGRALKFDHSEQGAIYAAINIRARLTSAAGSDIYRPTLEEQTVGDWQAELTRIQSEKSDTRAGAAAPIEWFTKVVATTKDKVTVSVAAETRQATETGGYGAITVTVAWVDGDWKMRLPRSRPEIVPNVDGYSSLGRIP